MYRVILTVWQEVEDDDGLYRTGTEQTVAAGLSESEANRIAGEWAEAHAGSDVSVNVEPDFPDAGAARQAQLEQEFNARQSALPLLRGARPS